MIDQTAILETYEQHYLPVYLYTLKLCRDELLAQNITADSLLSLLENAALVTNQRSYWFQTAYHNVVNAHRENIRHEPFENYLDLSEGDDLRPVEIRVEDRFSDEEKHSTVQKIFSCITPYEQQILTLRFMQNHSLERTAELLDKEPNAIKQAQMRAFTKIRKFLGLEVKNPDRTLCSYPGCNKPRQRKRTDHYCHKHLNIIKVQNYKKKKGYR